jgi:hypothetical protein
MRGYLGFTHGVLFPYVKGPCPRALANARRPPASSLYIAAAEGPPQRGPCATALVLSPPGLDGQYSEGSRNVVRLRSASVISHSRSPVSRAGNLTSLRPCVRTPAFPRTGRRPGTPSRRRACRGRAVRCHGVPRHVAHPRDRRADGARGNQGQVVGMVLRQALGVVLAGVWSVCRSRSSVPVRCERCSMASLRSIGARSPPVWRFWWRQALRRP